MTKRLKHHDYLQLVHETMSLVNDVAAEETYIDPLLMIWPALTALSRGIHEYDDASEKSLDDYLVMRIVSAIAEECKGQIC